MTRQRKWAAAAAISALLLTSGCAGGGASAHDRDMKACKKLATWISEGQDPDAYPDVMTYVMREAQDKVLRDELDELRAERIGGSAEEWVSQLDIVAYRCLEIYEEEQ